MPATTTPNDTRASGAEPAAASPRIPAGEAGRPWPDRFRFDRVKVLIVCRGPIRMEAIEVFERMGTQPCGMLLSEKDSVVYPRALSPELRHVGRNERVHRIPDYTGRTAQEKQERIATIIEIAQTHNYTHVFAGYGFMAEDFELIEALETAQIGFIGPASAVVRKAGAKDAAKSLAREIGVSVTPGLDNIEALTLLAQARAGEARAFLENLVRQHGLHLKGAEAPSKQGEAGPEETGLGETGLEETGLEETELAEAVLAAARMAKLELVTVAALQAETEKQVRLLLEQNPGQRLRFKHVGGGGGKGQRIVSTVEEVPAAVSEVLNEAGATAPGDNHNFLIERNIESTRHNEIQLLGNGVWCVALGGRDCSLQMHEQKLLEVSISAEMLAAAAAAQEAQALQGSPGAETRAAVLRRDLEVLQEMEEQAARFGQAVGLNSLSTFESIVDGDQHFFMEVNTRIQVEHRVTEMIYALRFDLPGEEGAFVVESLLEAMLWMAIYGPQLPRPERLPRHPSGAEVRVNSTNDALKPHAGGMVVNWSPPIEGETRDDQGIGIRNPDTGAFMPYHLAGAYDSNVALIVTYGEHREDNLQRLAEILRLTDLRGRDLMTNIGFHYGLLHWILGTDPMVKPSTRFVTAYLAGVGALKREGERLDLDQAWSLLAARQSTLGKSALAMLETKRTLILRPLRRLYRHPHLLAGWLTPWKPRRYVLENGRVFWRRNPLRVLEQLYRYLRLEQHPGVSPEERIWDHDQALLSAGLDFYSELEARLGLSSEDWEELSGIIAQADPPGGMAVATWPSVQAAHRGHQAGLCLLELPLLSGDDAGFYGIQVNDRLEVIMPAVFDSGDAAGLLRQALDEVPEAASDEVVAFTGGTFYTRPSPGEAPFVVEGQHVELGATLGLLEVMKMFNPIKAPFAGLVREVKIQSAGGAMVKKGQLLFTMEPDVPIIHESETERAKRLKVSTETLMERI